jgi:hypothetical protein
MKNFKDKLFKKFEDQKIFDETARQIKGSLGDPHPSEVTGDHDCTQNGLDCSDGAGTDAFIDNQWTRPDNDQC